MVGPQWTIGYWWSKWNLHIVCWGGVGCEWGQTAVYFGIFWDICFIPSKLSVFAVEPQCWHQDLLILVKSVIWHIQNIKKIHVGLEFEWGLYNQYWLSWECLSFGVFFSCLCDVFLGVTYANMLMTTQWPLKHAAQLTSLVWVCVVWRSESLLELMHFES